jgi:hypothetical protein
VLLFANFLLALQQDQNKFANGHVLELLERYFHWYLEFGEGE